MKRTLVCLLLLTPWPMLAQESALHAELRGEGSRISTACTPFKLKAFPGCAYTLFTDHPLHIAAGSLAPQNGFGVGPAFAWAQPTQNWRISWNTDAVVASSGSWRAGSYLQMIHNPHPKNKKAVVVVRHNTPNPPDTVTTPGSGEKDFTHPYTVLNFYAQATSLNTVDYFGLGNNSQTANAAVFGMTETIAGASAIKPVFEWAALRPLKLSLQGEINGRFVDLRGAHGQAFPSIETRYAEASAPGLTHQHGFLQMGEAVRIKPVLGKRLELNYLGKLQEFVAPANSHNSFLRWTVDLNHTYYLYGYTESAIETAPDSCTTDRDPCPPMLSPNPPSAATGTSRNFSGTIGVRLLVSESMTSAGNVVPFYFQQTLGGSDLNGAQSLPSYHDYRYRAPNILLLEQSVEHSIWGPFGVRLMADEGRVALTRGDLGFSHFRHSFAGGLTLRAGSFPMVSLMFAWGGREGHHNILTMNPSLLGASPRPQL